MLDCNEKMFYYTFARMQITKMSGFPRILVSVRIFLVPGMDKFLLTWFVLARCLAYFSHDDFGGFPVTCVSVEDPDPDPKLKPDPDPK